MKKIPTLFQRVFDENHKKTITNEVTPGCEVVLEGASGGSIATVKYDGACSAIIDGDIYRRYDAKQKYGKKPPEGAIPCQPEPDPITGHWPHWVKCVEGNPQDKYFLEAFDNSKKQVFQVIRHLQCARGTTAEKGEVWTCEAVGPAWQSNPHNNKQNILVVHGMKIIPWGELTGSDGKVSFESIRDYLGNDRGCNPISSKSGLPLYWPIEGIVFWYKGEPLCKIKRSDFGFKWPFKENKKCI